MSSETSPKVSRPMALTGYGAIAAVSSCLVAYTLFQQGVPGFIVLVLPLSCSLSFRWRLFALLVPLTIFIGVGLLGDFGGDTLAAVDQNVLGLASTVTIAAVWRFQSLGNSGAKSARATHPLGVGHVVSLVLIFLGWTIAGFLCDRFQEITADRGAYNEYAVMLRSRVGLIPEAYIGMTLLFTLTLLLWVTRGLFSYLLVRRKGSELAAMHLRSELWKWNGSEQRSISNQLRKSGLSVADRSAIVADPKTET